jgi:hypothetical protein
MEEVETSVMGALAMVEQDDRAELFATMLATYCMCCGGEVDEKGECCE